MRIPSVSIGILLLLATLVASGCGNRTLQSVTVSPATADAQNFSNGQVSFMATGTFSKAPSPVQLTSKDVTWCVGTSTGGCLGNVNPGSTLDQNGVAQCLSGFVGTTTILAGNMLSSPPLPDGGSQLKIFGSAQLTCP